MNSTSLGAFDWLKTCAFSVVVTLLVMPQQSRANWPQWLKFRQQTCKTRLAPTQGPVLQQLKERVLAHPLTGEAYRNNSHYERIRPEVLHPLLLSLREQSPGTASSLFEGYVLLSLIERRVPGANPMAAAIRQLYQSTVEIKDLVVMPRESLSEDLQNGLYRLDDLKELGFEVDLAAGVIEMPLSLRSDVGRNIDSFLSPADFQFGDWGYGEAIQYPSTTGWFGTQPSEYAMAKMLNLGGKAYFPMRVYNPETNVFVGRNYKVVALSDRGNPILLVHPRSHIIIPTQPRVEKMPIYSRRRTNMTELTRRKPVEVQLYNGLGLRRSDPGHFGHFQQLVVFNDGHHRMYQAWERRQPVHIEISSDTDFYEFSVTWGGIQTQ